MELSRSRRLVKTLRDCDGCGKRFVMTHGLQMYCPTCRGAIDNSMIRMLEKEKRGENAQTKPSKGKPKM